MKIKVAYIGRGEILKVPVTWQGENYTDSGWICSNTLYLKDEFLYPHSIQIMGRDLLTIPLIREKQNLMFVSRLGIMEEPFVDAYVLAGEDISTVGFYEEIELDNLV